MDTIHHQPLEGFRILHFYGTPERKTLWIFQILPDHIVAGTVRLILHVAEHLIQHGQSVVLIDQQILIGQADILLTLEDRILWVGIDDIRAIDELLIARTARSIVAGQRRLGQSAREPLTDDLPIKVGIEPHEACIALILDLRPLAQDLLHRAVCQHVVGVDAGVQLRVDVGIGHVVGGVHPAIFFVDVLDLEAVVAALPIVHQLSGIVGGTVVNDQPNEVLAALAAKALIGARERMCPIVGGGEDR